MQRERLLKLLIVEDEANTRGLLRMIIDWSTLGVEVIGEAATGAEALDMMEETPPDIVLTDIEMPYMNGLVLCKRIHESHRDTAVVILTAHDRFAYTQEALRHGASHYVLKPLDKSRLEQAISEVVCKIREQRKLLSKMELTYNYIRRHSPFFRDRMLMELITKGSSKDLIETLDAVGVHFEPDGRCSLALLGIADSGSGGAAEKYMLLRNIRAYIEENYAASESLFVLDDGLDRMVLLTCSPQADLAGLCTQTSHSAEDETRSRMRYSVGDPCDSPSELAVAYRRTRDMLRLEIIAAESIFQHDAAPSDGRTLDEQTRDLLLFIKSGLSDRAASLANNLIQQCAAQYGGSLDAIKMYAIGFLSRALDTLTDIGVSWMGLITLAAPYSARIAKADVFSEVEKLFAELTLALSDLADKRRKQSVSETILRVVKYIETEYSNTDLSLKFTADKHRVNASYLSRSFKAYTGKPFSEYLVEFRIRKACEILRREEMKAYQLAQLVGIPDPNYFVKCFKKIMGMSFQQFKASEK
ncbi:MAG: response regulator [Oscillospiraceae bacterium]|nr:response regulator [Oscillospiraceae bacterium]